MDPCSPEVVQKILNTRRIQLEGRGLSADQIAVDLAHMKAALSDPAGYAKLVQPKGLNADEQQELDGLIEKARRGFDADIPRISSILSQGETERLRVLVYKKSNREGPQPKITRFETAESMIQRYRDSGDEVKANRLATLLRKARERAEANSRRGQDNAKLNELELKLDDLNKDIDTIVMLLNQNKPKAINENRLELVKLGKRLQRINNKIDSEKNSKRKGALKKQASEIVKKIKELEKKSNKVVEQFKQRNPSERKALAELIKQKRDLIDQLSKDFGIYRGVSLDSFIDSVPQTLASIAKDIEEMKRDISFREDVIEEMFKESNTIESALLAKVLGENFVMQRVDKNKSLTRKEVKELFKEWKSLAFEYAGSREKFIADTDFADEESLDELAASLNDPTIEGVADETDGTVLLIPSMSIAEQMRTSKPGEIPSKNVLGEKDGEVLYRALKSLLTRMETYRRLPQFGRFVDIAFIAKIISQIPKIDDVDATILFKKAIQWRDSNTSAGDMSYDEILSITKTLLKELGLDESVLSSPEFTDPVNWKKNTKVFSLDLETYLDGDKNIHTVIFTEEGREKDPRSVRSSADGVAFTSEELMNLLIEIESKQNQGMALVTYNGNSFDLYAIAQKIGTPEATEMASRIMLRSFDIFQNMRAFRSTTENSTNATSQMYKLGNVAAAVGVSEFKTEDNYMPPLLKKRSLDQTVTIEDLSAIPDEVLSAEEKEIIVEDINKVTSDQARQRLEAYSLADGALNIQVFRAMQEKNGASVRVRHTNRNVYAVTIEELVPTWASVTQHSPTYNGISESVAQWTTTASGRTMATAFDSFLGQEENNTTVIDLDKAQPIVMALMAASLRFAPNTESFGRVLSKVIKEGLTPEQQAYMTAVKISKLNAEAAKEINKTTYLNNDSRLPIGIIGADKNGLVPGIEFAEGNEKDQKNQYISAVVDGFKEQLGQFYQKKLPELAEAENFKPQESTNREDDYIMEFIIATIKKYSDLRDFDIVDFGNGNIDYAVATSLGRGIAQIITSHRQGFKPSLNAKALDPRTNRYLSSAGGRPDAKIYQSLIFRAPLVGEVHHIFPRALPDIESAFVDYRLRQRIQHILDSDIDDPEAVINAYKDLTEDPDEVLTDRRPDLLSMGLTPNINNRASFNKLPTIEDLRARTIEALLDMPELLLLWQHDSMTYAPGAKIFLDEKTKNKMFKEDAFSPGSLSATAVLSGMGPLFAHIKTYPFLGEDILYQSLERGIKAYKEGNFSISNYFDFNMNGAHHMAALSLMYLDEDGSRLDEMLKDIGLEDEAKDRYQEAVTLLRDNLDKIEKVYISQKDTNGAEQARRLKEFLTESAPEAREGFKNAVIARLYSGGLKAVRDGIEKWMSESKPVGLTGVDADFIAQLLMNTKAYLQFNILDEALGGVTSEQRQQLAAAIATELRDVYQNDWTENLRQKAKESGYTIAAERMFSMNFLHEAIEERIQFIAEMRKLDVETVRAEYQERIDKAMEFVKSLPEPKKDKEGKEGLIELDDEQARKLNIILMGKEEWYKTTPTLIALNALQRVPYRLRGIENDGIRGRIQEHSNILGRRIEESDILGFEDFNIYFTMGFDSSGGRGYFVGHKFQPINSELSSVERENTPGGKDDQKYAMWGFNKNNLGKLSRDKAELEVQKLMARHIAMQLSPRYAPKFGNYNMAESETREGFMQEWYERSTREDQSYVDYIRNEPSLSNEMIDLRRSNGGLLKNAIRFLVDPSRTLNSAMDIEYNPGSERSIKGLGAFRPEYAAIPWQERGIMSLQQMFYNKLIQDAKAEKVARMDKEITSVNDVIPSEARGYANRYKNSKAPYVYPTPVDGIYEMTTGNTSRRLELRANSLQYTLEKFGMTHGHKDLVEDQNWAKLYTIWKINNLAVSPYVRDMAKLRNKPGQESKEYVLAQSHALNMYQALTQLWSFHDSVSAESRSYLEFGKMIGIEGKTLQEKHYIDMLFYFAQRGINVLKPITLGLEPTNNIVASGEPSSDERDTRITTLTVQSIDSLQMIYNVVYETVGREIATEYMRKVDPENFKSLEKDGNGFVLLSSVPKEHQQAVFKEIFTSDRTQRTEEFDLYLFIDEVTQETQIGRKKDFSNAKNPKRRGGDKGMPRFDTSRTNGNTIYKLTPEDLQNMFTQLQNQVLLYNTELATALGTDIGMVDNENMVFMNAERRRFYETQRMAYADEMDILSILHSRSGSPLRTTFNMGMSGDFGLPVEVYDAGYYVAGKDADPRGTAFDRAWQGKISRAIETARMYGLTEEAERLETLLTSDNKYLIPATIIMSQVEGREARLKRLRSYVGSAMKEEQFNKIYKNASLFINDYLAAVTRDVPRNKFSHQAKRFVELNGPIEVINVSPKVLKAIGVEDTSSREEIQLAKQALENANRQYTQEADILLTDSNINTLAESDGLTDAFQSNGQHIEIQISELVQQGAITEETAELYRGMFGIILTHNKEFVNNLSIVLDPSLERAGLSQRYGDRFVIKLNPKLLKRRAVPEALEVMAHEISHIARLRHLETESETYRGFIAAFRTREGKEAITDMVTSMYAGDKGEINALLDHYTTNAEEFLAEWGAFVLISRTINNKSVINKINQLREKYNVVDEATSWWERAFNRIKRIASSITQRMQVFRQSNRKAMEYMDNLVEVMFNFGNTYSTSRAAVDNITGTFGTPLVELERGTGIIDSDKIVDLLNKYNTVDALESRVEFLSEEEQATFINYKNELAELPANTILGLDTREYIETINRLVQYGSETGQVEITRKPRSKDERIALATFVLERISKIRGVRPDNLSVISRLVRDMPKATRVRNWIIETFLTGTARKVGEQGKLGGGLGGGSSANLTYASAESILVALGFIMNTVKGGGIFSEKVGGILQDKNYIEQWSRPVVLMSERIKNSYNQREAQLIRSAAFYYMLLGKPSDRNQIPIGEDLTNEMFELAKKYADTYASNISNFVDLAVEYETYTSGFVSPEDMIALRINNTFFEKDSESIGAFEQALSKLYTKKIEDNMKDEGMADPYSIYLSGGMFSISDPYSNNSPIEEFYTKLQSEMIKLNEAQRLILDEIEAYAFELYKEKNPNTNLTLSSFKYTLKLDTTNSNWQSAKEHLLEAATRILRQANSGKSYSTIFKSLNSSQRNTVIKYLQGNLNNQVSESALRQEQDIVRGRLPYIFYGSTKPPKYFQSNVIVKKNSPIRLRVLNLINSQGHGTVMPNAQSLDVTAKDIFIESSGLDPNERSILRNGFSTDLKSIIVGMERTMARSAYNRKAIQDLSGVRGVSFANLIEAIKGAKQDSDWDMVLDEVQRKHDLAIGAATRVIETQGSGEENLGLRAADFFTTALWGPNRNAAALINEGTLSTVVTTIYGGNPIAFMKDVVSGILPLFTNVISRKLGNRLLNNSIFTSVPQALFDIDTATRGFLEHQLITKDEEEAVNNLDQNGFKKTKPTRIIGWYLKKLKDSHLIVEPALRAAMMRQAQVALIRRINKLEKYLDFIEQYDGPRGPEMYKRLAVEVGTTRILDLWGSEKLIVQYMHESGLLDRKTIKALKYIVTELNGISKTGILGREFFDISEIQRMIEESVTSRLFDKMPNSGGLTKNDLYEALNAVGKFQVSLMRQAITEGNTMDRQTEGRPILAFMNLYRSFPKLFVTQHALESYGRTTGGILATKVITAGFFDIIYNLALLWAVGVITEDDIERWKKEGPNIKDYTLLTTVVARNPFFTTRMLPSIVASLLPIVAGKTMAGDKMSIYDMTLAGLPPAVAAILSGVAKSIQIGQDAINRDGEFSWGQATDFAARLIPFIDPITRYYIASAIDPEFKQNKNKTNRGRNTSPINVGNTLMDNQLETERSLFRAILNEAFPTGMKNLVQPMPSFMDAQMPPMPFQPRKATELFQNTQSPAEGVSEPPAAPQPQPTTTPSPTEGPRSINPAKPPEQLGGP